MEAPAQIGIYLAVLRKHLLLLTISASLVVAAGVFYVMRQQKVFASKATLAIETPTRNVAGGGDFADRMQADQEELLTQVALLKENKKLALRAIENLRAAGVDTAAGGYTEVSLPARVKVEPIPGTSLWSFSLTGPDAATLPEAVNAYALVFQEWSEGKSASRTEAQEVQFQKFVEEAEKKLADLEAEQSRLTAAHKDVNLAGGQNPAADELQSLPKAATLEAERDADAAARAAIVSALAKSGVDVARRPDGSNQIVVRPGGAPIASCLVDDEHVAALPCVRSNEVVRDVLGVERDALARDRALAEKDLKPDYKERVAARAEAAEARVRRGGKMANVIEDELDALDARLARSEKLIARVAELKVVAIRNAELRQEYDDLDKKVKGAERELDLVSNRLKSFQNAFLPDAQTAAGRSSRATRRIILETPASGAEQIAPKVPLILGLTAFAAIAVGLGLVLLFEYLDDTVKSKEDFDRYVSLPFLGFIPRIETKDAVRPDIAADAKTGSAIAEAFRAVRTSILFSRSGKPVRTILVTSAGPGEGKTTVATNLAVTLAKHKGPVLLVDADLRRPRVAKALGIENKIGLTNYLIGEMTLDQVIQKTSVEGLFALTSGPIPPNPAELLHGDQLSAMLEQGLQRFDRIVIDSPPLIAVSDARVIARCTDGLYLVISMGKTSRRLIQRSLESLTSIGFSVHGAILNNVSAPTGRYGYYYYRDYNYGKSYYVQPPPAPES